jgi:hypothetical protein
MLYPTELRAENYRAIKFGGRGERIRTFDILLPKQALYRAELRPDELEIIATNPNLGKRLCNTLRHFAGNNVATRLNHDTN